MGQPAGHLGGPPLAPALAYLAPPACYPHALPPLPVASLCGMTSRVIMGPLLSPALEETCKAIGGGTRAFTSNPCPCYHRRLFYHLVNLHIRLQLCQMNTYNTHFSEICFFSFNIFTPCNVNMYPMNSTYKLSNISL